MLANVAITNYKVHVEIYNTRKLTSPVRVCFRGAPVSNPMKNATFDHLGSLSQPVKPVLSGAIRGQIG